MNTEGAGNDALSAASYGKAAAMSVDGKRLVSEAEWQLLHREVRCCFFAGHMLRMNCWTELSVV